MHAEQVPPHGRKSSLFFTLNFEFQHFAKKNIFCVIISRLQRFFPKEYKFMPDSFLLPDEMQDLELHMKHNPTQTFICKPSRGRGGEGITLAKKFNEIPKAAHNNEFLIQRYIENPLLIQSKKFDVRLYVVIKGVNRIEGYMCEEGIARFCTVSLMLFSCFCQCRITTRSRMLKT